MCTTPHLPIARGGSATLGSVRRPVPAVSSEASRAAPTGPSAPPAASSAKSSALNTALLRQSTKSRGEKGRVRGRDE
eukprot:558076-Pleurochrysis_carterae.AAC.1